MIWRMSGRRAAGGFTLIELLVTCAVITILVSVGVPMYGEFTKGSAVTSRTSDLVSAINYTRSEAVSRRASVNLMAIGGNWRNGWQVDTVVTPTTLQVVDFGAQQADVSIAAGSVTQITFDGQGRTLVAPTFTICPNGGGNGRTVTVNMFGRTTVTQLVCP